MNNLLTYRTPLLILVGFLLGMAFKCDTTLPETKTEVKEKIEYVTREHKDTIHVTEFGKPVIKYVDKVLLKTDKQIVYVDSFDYHNIERPLKVNEYNELLDKGRNKAFLKIGTTGELKYLTGSITSTDSIITKTIDKTITKTIEKPSKGLYLSGEYITPLGNDKAQYRAHLDYLINGKVIIGTSGGYDSFTQKPNIGLKIGVKL